MLIHVTDFETYQPTIWRTDAAVLALFWIIITAYPMNLTQRVSTTVCHILQQLGKF